MPAVGIVDHGRKINQVFVGEGEGDDAKDMNEGRDAARRRGEALKGMARHELLRFGCHCVCFLSMSMSVSLKELVLERNRAGREKGTDLIAGDETRGGAASSFKPGWTEFQPQPYFCGSCSWINITTSITSLATNNAREVEDGGH